MTDNKSHFVQQPRTLEAAKTPPIEFGYIPAPIRSYPVKYNP